MTVILITTSSVYASETGFNFGSSQLNLMLAIAQAYDSNVYCGNNPLGDLVLHIAPSIKFSLEKEKVAFLIGGTLDVVRYYGITNGTLNGVPYNTKQLSTIYGNASTVLNYNPSKRFGLMFRNDFYRTADPRDDVFGTFARVDNTTGIGFEFSPSESAFKINLNYLFNFDIFDASTGLSDADYYSNMPSFILKWYFIPKTALVFDINANILRYPNQWNYPDQASGRFSNYNLVNFNIGISGVISPKLSVIFMIGYGNAFIQQNSTPDQTINQQGNDQTVLADVVVNYKMNENVGLDAGYKRAIYPGSFFAFFNSNLFFINYRQKFIKKLSISLGPSVDLQYYGKPIFSGTNISESRSDIYGMFNIIAKYDILKWLDIALTNNFYIRSTNFKDATGNAGYIRNITSILIDFHY